MTSETHQAHNPNSDQVASQLNAKVTKPSPLARPCRMTPISPIEAVKQMIAARRQQIGQAQYDSRERAEALAAKDLKDLLKTKAVRGAVARAVKARKAHKAAERQLSMWKLQINDNGTPAWTYYERQRRLDAARGPSRQARLDQLAVLKATAYRELIGKDVKQVQAYLKKLQAQLDKV